MPTNRAYTLIIVALVVGIILGYAFGLAFQTPAEPVAEEPMDGEEPQTEEPMGLTGTVTIGALLDLSGGLSTYGENSQAALELAEEEINEWLEAIGANWNIDIRFEDTQVEPSIALSKIQTLAGQGVKFIIGPMSSGEVKEIREFANNNRILVISQSSTSPALAIPDDFIFRFTPTDLLQGPAAVAILEEQGIEHLVIMWRGDTWGDGLKESIAEEATNLGIVVHDGPKYDPQQEEFTSEVASLADTVQGLVDQFGADKVGVALLGFKEVAAVMTAALDYDVLSQVKWIGSDGSALLQDIVTDPNVASFAASVEFLNPIFAPGASPFNEKVRQAVMDRFDREPDAYAYAAYDAAWAIALSIQFVGDDDPEKVKEILPDTVARMVGASGVFQLDENGDRATADYDIYVPVEADDGSFTWMKAGRWLFTTGEIQWEEWWLERG